MGFDLHSDLNELGNIEVRPNVLAKKGDFTPGHTHEWDHLTQFLRGSFKVNLVTPQGEAIERVFVAPDYFVIDKDVEHRIEALEDDCLFWCVYAHRDNQGYVVQKGNGIHKNYC